MRRILATRLLQLSLLALCAPLAAHAAPAMPTHAEPARNKEKQAQALLDKAVAQFKKNSQATLAAINKPGGIFRKGEYYIFVVRQNGDFIANAGDVHELVGMNAVNLTDASGKPFIKEMLDAAKAKGGGSIEYVWLNRATNRVENKTTVFRRVGDTILASGYYVPRESAEQAEALLNEAAFLLDSEGIDKAAARFNDPKGAFVKDDLYVYVVNAEDHKFYAHGTSPSLLGVDATTLRDAVGTPLIQEMLDKAKEAGSGTEDYVWRNPVTNKVEHKHAIFRKIGKYLVAVGYYSK